MQHDSLTTTAYLFSMARPIFLARSVDPLPVGDESHVDDRLIEDRIDFDAWLLPPEVSSRNERVIRFVSTVSGPLVFGVAFIAFMSWVA